jgi:hypothetical protein
VLDFREWICGLSMICSGSIEDKLRLMFRAYDRERDGYLSKEDMANLLVGVYKTANRFADSVDDVRSLVETMFLNLGIKGEGLLSFDDFQRAVHMEPLIIECLAFEDFGDVLDPASSSCSGDALSTSPSLSSSIPEPSPTPAR